MLNSWQLCVKPAAMRIAANVCDLIMLQLIQRVTISALRGKNSLFHLPEDQPCSLVQKMLQYDTLGVSSYNWSV